MNPFTHLHVHTEFSPLDGLARIPDIMERVKTLGMPAIAMTDHGNVAGAPEFYLEAKKAGIRPLLGQEFYVVPDASMKDKSKDEYAANRHLVLIALNLRGWHTLVELTSIANSRENYHYKPRIDHDILRKFSDRFGDILATSSCLNSEIALAHRNDGVEAANKMLKFYRSIFPNFYLELQRHEIEKKYLKDNKSARARNEQEFRDLLRNYEKYLLKAGKKYRLPFVITNDSHYVKKEEHEIHDLLLAIQTKKPMSAEDRFRFNGHGYHIKSVDEMRKTWDDSPEIWLESQKSMAQILKLTKNFKVPEFESTTWHVPDIPGMKKEPPEVIRKKCYRALKEKGLDENKKYVRRLKHELKVIRQANFEKIFLIVEDYVNWARAHGIQIGPGRGSMVGSLVSWLLGITEIDPIKYRLLFERAINPARPSIPDFDIDFEGARIEEVIDYVRKTYGESNVMLIGTQHHMAAKMTLKNVLRTFEVPFTVSNEITAEMPDSADVVNHKASGELEDLFATMESPTLKALIKEYPILKPASIALQGLLTGFGTHAAGVVISDKGRDLTKEIPKMLIASSDKVSSQYDMEAVKKLHLVKFDFLRITNLDMIANAINLIGHNPFENMSDDYYDEKTFEMMRNGDLLTVFQFQGGAMRRCLMEMGVNEFEDLVATNALARPGSINFLPHYIEGKRNPKGIKFACKEVKPILGYTYGVILYQEQVMQIVKDLAGWDDLGADRIKEAIKSKSGKDFDEMEPLFLDGCEKNGISRKAAKIIWKNIDDYRSYGFNRAHAVAYSVVGFKTAYLKRHYPKEWLTAVLQANPDKNFTDIIEEIRRERIALQLPSVNRSEVHFTMNKKGVRFGLAQIKGIGESAAQAIIEERRQNGLFASYDEFRERMAKHRAVNNKARYEALEKSGALSTIGGPKPNRFLQQEYLGTFVTEYPLDPYREAFAKVIESPENKRKFALNKSTVYWGGIVSKIKEIVTKKGDKMAFVTVSYYGQTLDVTFFPQQWARVRNKIQKDVIVAMSGTRDVERNTIVAERVRTYE